MFLWRNKKTYPKIISKYSSLTILLPPNENMKLFCFHQTKYSKLFCFHQTKNLKLFCFHKTKIWNYSASTKQKYEIILLPPNTNMKLVCFHQTKIWNYSASTKQKYEIQLFLQPPDIKYYHKNHQMQFSSNLTSDRNMDVNWFHHIWIWNVEKIKQQ